MLHHRLTIPALAACVTFMLALFISSPTQGQTVGAVPGLGSPLSGLPLERTGTAMHAGSWDRKGRNGDFRTIEPGHPLVLLNYHGAGIVRRFWCTVPSDTKIRCQLILRMYWDGEKHPSVRVPLGAFFGVGFGKQVDYRSAPLEETSGGYNCFWPMPFHKSAYWTITNETKHPVNNFYWNIGFDAYKHIPKKMLEFHALWRQENPVPPGQNYVILNTTGRGQYVGTALFMQDLQNSGLEFLEGNEMVYIDAPKHSHYYQGIGPPKPGQFMPAIEGTGTEDYFCSGYYFNHGTYSAPYHGCVIKSNKLKRISAYRWHIEDAIPFKKSIRFTIQVGPWDNIRAAYASVAYWYQTQPHPVYPKLPPPAELLPVNPVPLFKVPHAIEGESMVPQAKATSGYVGKQNMSGFNGNWSGGAQLFWHGQTRNATMTIQLPAKKAGDYFLAGYFTKAPDYGIFQVLSHGRKLGHPVNAYAGSVMPTGRIPLGRIYLNAGNNPLVIRMAGKARESLNYFFGLDALVLKPAP
jgi:hypothetical protein